MSEISTWKRPGALALFALAMASFVPVNGQAQDTAPVEATPQPAQGAQDAGLTDADDPAGSESVALLAGLVTVSVAPDQQIAGTTGEEVTRTMLAHPETPGLIHTALIAGLPGADPAAVTAALTDRLDSIDSVAQGSHAGAPVWVVSGAARHAPDGGRPGRGQPRAHLMITQSCMPGGGPVMLGVATTPTRSAPPVLDAILSTLSLTLPGDAAPCPPELGAAIMALPIGALDHPDEALPLVMVPHERFGLGLMAPDDMRVRRDRDSDDGRREFWLTNADPDTGVGSDIVLLVMTQAQRDAITSEPVGSPGFLAALQELDDMPRAPTGETVALGSILLQVFRGQMTVAQGGTRRATYLFSDSASATGQHVWIAITSTGTAEIDAEALGRAVIDGLSMTDPLAFDGQPPQAFLDGTVRIAVAADQIIDAQQERARAARFALSDAGAPGQTQVFFAIEARETAQPDLVDDVAQRLIQVTSVSTQVVSGIPVWVMDGGTDRNPDMSRPDAGQTRPARIIVTRDCLPGAGPLVIGALATQAHLDRVGGFDAVTGAVTLTMPDGSRPCPDTLDRALAAVPLTGAAPQPDQIPQPDRTPPTSADPEALAFEAALAAGTAPALWTFLKAYPQGEYIAQARAALQSLLQPPPAAPTAPPSPGKGG